MKNINRVNRVKKEELLVDESIFSIANGYMGTRGTFTEGYGTEYEYNQTYINGLYEFYDYHYEENLTGFPQEGQKFVNIIDGTNIRITFQKNRINLETCNIVSLEREYNLEKGITLRKIHYQTKDEKYDFYLEETKFVSRFIKELIGIELIIYSPNYPHEIKVKSFLRQSKRNHEKNNDPRIQTLDNSMEIIAIDCEKGSITSKTERSKFTVESTMIHNVDLYNKVDDKMIKASGYFKIDKPLKVQKYVIHSSSLYDENYEARTKEIVKKLESLSWDNLLQEQEKYSNEFWNNSNIETTNAETTKLLNYNIYQLNNCGGESDIHNISAKGLSGEGYEGHYFWDTEIYMIPFFVLTNPLKAKNLLLYRYQTLELAREEARELGYSKGVKIPWRTINGEEASPYYPAGSAQFHINSDVAYAIVKYFEATNDIDFLINYGFEMLIETARFLQEATNYHEGFYHLNSVTGPDEYTTVVDDNFYTNILMKYHFNETVYLYNKYKKELEKCISKLGITEKEMKVLEDIGENIYLPFDKELNIFAQDKNFLSKARLNLDDIPKDKFPLLLNYHPLYLYKHQVLKQADTMLALLLLDFEQLDILEDTFNYYEPITTHDSSLSKCIYSIMAFKLNKSKMARKYFNEVLNTDYKNTHNNTEQGLHVANLGGSYIGFAYGVLGLRIHRGYLKLEPHRMNDLEGFNLKIQYQNETVTISLSDKLVIETTGDVKLNIYGKMIEVSNVYKTDLPE
ncbi:Alpha,alpha-trehalose phosphorylase [Candidatus Izimaplasma bacterium HR1]|jgi:alpha,alpha-trehalose phosphorylase|uniref:glycoside hydrolase family 65 protein n=1 Tax=Candidatus Izimoplasma sp. HR1 TaxID=1541959 RepID=UPI0004F8CAC1|nr:Alpha,alpha-trehalose phosphorylase [Candidatus Izimaplasma bacterium HR1]